MGLEGSYSFAGIGTAEAKPRENENRSGVPPVGSGLTALLSAPAVRTRGIRVMNQGEDDCLLVLAHGSKEKTVTGEYLAAGKVSTTVYKGKLQFGAIKPTTVSITATSGGGSVPLTDPDGDGILYDTALVARGTINYVTGEYSVTFSSAATEPVTAGYTHTDWTQFTSPTQTELFTAAGSYPETFTLGFGRVVPGTVTLTDGTRTFVDDGKGNMIETTTTAVKRGTIDYAAGVVTLTAGSATLTASASAVTVTYKFNPFAMLLVKGGGHTGASILSDSIPELGSKAFADGIKGETLVALLGECRTTGKTTNVVAWFAHHGEEPYRVKPEYSAFAPGGYSNDPRRAQ